MSQETFEKTFTVQDTPEVSIHNVRGSVTVKTGSNDTVSVTAVKQSDTGSTEDTKVTMTQENNTISLAAKFENSVSRLFNLGTRKPCRVDFTVTVPASCTLTIRCVSSSTSVEDLNGQVAIQTVSGPVSLHRITGSLAIKTVSGSISASQIHTDIAFNSVSGDLDLHDSDIQKLSMKTVSGDVKLKTPLHPDGDYHIHTISGDVKWESPGDSPSASVLVSSISGQVYTRNAQAHTKKRSGASKKRVDLYGGGVPIHFKSISGDISFEFPQARSSSETSAPSQAQEPQHDTLDLLEKVARGELSVDNAVQEMK